MPHIYLDHSATTPVDTRVLDVMLPFFTQLYGNASSGHVFGRDAVLAIEEARETIASVLHCKPAEIIFTSGGSESDNLAVRGAAWANQGRGKHLITTPLEHGAVGKTLDQLVTLNGFESTYLRPDHYGIIHPAELVAACRPDTTVCSIMYANNEVGTIQPIRELATVAHANGVIFHTDAVQAAGQLTLDVQYLGVDLLSLSGHKFYGPKGVGALYVREGVDIIPTQTGGSHEFGLRAGTLNTPLIVGLAEALRLAYEYLQTRIAHYTALRDRLIGGVLAVVPNARLSGHPTNRLPSHASFVFQGEYPGLLDDLAAAGVAASAASACKTGSTTPSSVLLALGYDPLTAANSLRLTVGVQTTVAEIDYTINLLKQIFYSHKAA
ncbi:MAG: cysteine desulfurase [Anaerolineae bacterium]|nr:cysteine desulfurase [Anaerolineae bacterium]